MCVKREFVTSDDGKGMFRMLQVGSCALFTKRDRERERDCRVNSAHSETHKDGLSARVDKSNQVLHGHHLIHSVRILHFTASGYYFCLQ
jgi:hypothetical protein